MALRNVNFTVNRLSPSTVQISGTVIKDSVGVVRTLRLFSRTNEDIQISTTSEDGTGAYSFEAPGGPHDIFGILLLGAEGENSAVFDWIRE